MVLNREFESSTASEIGRLKTVQVSGADSFDPPVHCSKQYQEAQKPS